MGTEYSRKLKCTCGTCNVCKTRERMRRLRAGVARPGAPAEAFLRTTTQHDTFIWINGNLGGYDYDTISGLIYQKQRDIDDRIRCLQSEANSFSQKERRGNKYWYRWINGAWKYIGPVNSTEDPRAALYAEITDLERKREVVKKQIMSTIMKRLGDHLLINKSLFMKYVKVLPDNIIDIREVLI